MDKWSKWIRKGIGVALSSALLLSMGCAIPKAEAKAVVEPTVSVEAKGLVQKARRTKAPAVTLTPASTQTPVPTQPPIVSQTTSPTQAPAKAAPQITISYNSKGKVTKLEAGNEAGKTIIARYYATNEDLDDVVEDMVERLSRAGYMTKTDCVVISLSEGAKIPADGTVLRIEVKAKDAVAKGANVTVINSLRDWDRAEDFFDDDQFKKQIQTTQAPSAGNHGGGHSKDRYHDWDDDWDDRYDDDWDDRYDDWDDDWDDRYDDDDDWDDDWWDD